MITFLDLGKFGRFGNQLWQIASTIGIATKNYTEFVFPTWKYNSYFINKFPQASIDYLSGIINKIYKEGKTTYNNIKIDKKFNYNLVGYFQSYKYFEHCEDLIRHYFTFKRCDVINAISIHVRRGDYLDLQQVYPIYGIEYYKKAVEYFGRNETYIVFSDDIDWCKKIFTQDNFPGMLFIFDMSTDEIDSFIKMSCCKHNIITNSSFSWWAAWLNKNKDKIIITPEVWVYTEDRDDRIPNSWVKI